jgi:co-chaperonin GroES (HSP10)
MIRGIKNPVGTNVLAVPIYETVKKQRLKKLTESDIKGVLTKTASGIILGEEEDFYEEYEEQVETSVVRVLDVGKQVTLNIEVGKAYLFNKVATPITYNGEKYLIIRQDAFYIEVDI